MQDHDYAAYIGDLVILLREAADAAKRRQRAEPDNADFHAGRVMAYVEVLSLMQSQADSFMIPREELKLDSFDPASDILGSSAGAGREPSGPEDREQ
jgi:hypothetical protein